MSLQAIIAQAAFDQAMREEAFVRDEMKRLGISHLSAADLRAHGYCLQIREGSHEPIGLIHDPGLDVCLQLMDC